MSYKDGIRIAGKHSYDDFGLVLNSREIGYPSKKSIRKTVPYMNGYYDYTMLYRGAAWGERVVTYTFDVIGFTVEEMEAERVEVVNWLCNIHDEDIFDDALPDFHFRGSFDAISVSDEGEKATLSFSYVCYPFMIKNTPKVRKMAANGTLSLVNEGQPVPLKASTTASCTVTRGGVKHTIPANVSDYDVFILAGEKTDIDISISGGEVELRWTEEVL